MRPLCVLNHRTLIPPLQVHYRLPRDLSSLFGVGTQSVTMLNGSRRKTAADAEQLRKRVSELEGALQRLQATVSDDPHPLLRGDKAPAGIPVEEPPLPSSSSASGSTPPRADSSSSPTTGSTPPQREEASDEEADSLDAYGAHTPAATLSRAHAAGSRHVDSGDSW